MKIGDLVRPKGSSHTIPSSCPIVQDEWLGVIIGFTHGGDSRQSPFPIVYWNLEYREEEEFPYQLEVVK